MEEKILLVDEHDNPLNYEEKLKVHENGALHRAFSIFIFNDKNEMLLQKRALSKYHCGGFWSNTCCSHQRENEVLNDAAHRRLNEEMGFDTEIFDIFSFRYDILFENGLSENELDHIYVGNYENNPVINPKEVDDFKWIKYNELKEWIKTNPEEFTPWFLIAVERLEKYKK